MASIPSCSIRFQFALGDGHRQAGFLSSGSMTKPRFLSWREIVGIVGRAFFFFPPFVTNDPFPVAQAVKQLPNIVRLAVKFTQAGNPAAGEMLSGASAKERVPDYSVEAQGLRSVNLQVLVRGQSYFLCLWYPPSTPSSSSNCLALGPAIAFLQATHSTSSTAQRSHTHTWAWVDNREVEITVLTLSPTCRLCQWQWTPQHQQPWKTWYCRDCLHLAGQSPSTRLATPFLILQFTVGFNIPESENAISIFYRLIMSWPQTWFHN